MRLIADSGYTKTSWALIKTGAEPKIFNLTGFNPNYQSSSELIQDIEVNLQPSLEADAINEVYFYGAGISNENNARLVFQALTELFPLATIHVEHDLLAAARAMCFHSNGFVGILGTGANSCYFDGTKILKNIPSVGYLLQDEGSGIYLAAKFLKLVIRNRLPGELLTMFLRECHLTEEGLLTSIYQAKNEARYISSFNGFLSKHQDHPFIHDLVKAHFTEFHKQVFSQYALSGSDDIYFVGSIAYYFRDILTRVMIQHGHLIKEIVKNPIHKLIKYHL